MADSKTPDTPASTQTAPAFTLVVIHPFGERRRGDAITDADEIAEVMAGENAHHVNRVAK
ncbi:hypothetical protein [Paraburkholderia tropica]|uniref:hypothetical protein n=1 Tax=Paraburkholderia tropica TaxID=92647 RepID=UPI001F3689F4|nr:hypothetical protein [Paraburkholderia tropica]